MDKDCLLTMEGSEANIHVARQVLQRARSPDVLARVCIVRGLSDRTLARPEVLVTGGGGGNDDAAAAGACEVCSKGGVSSSSCSSFSNGCSCGRGTLLCVTDLDELPARSKLAMLPTELSGAFALVFLDHDKDAYKPDLDTLMRLGALSADCRVAVNNVISPGAPGFLDFLGEGSGWSTTVEKMHFERKGFETGFRKVRDGMSVSLRTV